MAEIGIAFQTDKPHGQYSKLAAAEAYGLDVVGVFADLVGAETLLPHATWEYSWISPPVPVRGHCCEPLAAAGRGDRDPRDLGGLRAATANPATFPESLTPQPSRPTASFSTWPRARW